VGRSRLWRLQSPRNLRRSSRKAVRRASKNFSGLTVGRAGGLLGGAWPLPAATGPLITALPSPQAGRPSMRAGDLSRFENESLFFFALSFWSQRRRPRTLDEICLNGVGRLRGARGQGLRARQITLAFELAGNRRVCSLILSSIEVSTLSASGRGLSLIFYLRAPLTSRTLCYYAQGGELRFRAPRSRNRSAGSC